MKYYLIEISTGDSKITGRSIYGYSELKQAVGQFHKKLGTAMSSELFESELVIVTDSFGNVLKSEKYAIPVVVEEPEIEEPVVEEETPEE